MGADLRGTAFETPDFGQQETRLTLKILIKFLRFCQPCFGSNAFFGEVFDPVKIILSQPKPVFDCLALRRQAIDLKRCLPHHLTKLGQLMPVGLKAGIKKIPVALMWGSRA